jgi:hypothetical protein
VNVNEVDYFVVADVVVVVVVVVVAVFMDVAAAVAGVIIAGGNVAFVFINVIAVIDTIVIV